MAQSKQVISVRRKTIGDAAVDGLLSGIVAGLAMAAYLLAYGLLRGESAGTVLGRFDLGPQHSAVTGLLLHLATSAIYGAIFALALRVLSRWTGSYRRYAWLAGMVYGLALFAVAWLALAPQESALREFGALNLAVAHALFGAVLGYQIGRHGG